MVWSSVSNWDDQMLSGPRLRYQCQGCGLLVGSFLRHALASPNTPEVDVELLKRARNRHEQERAALLRQFQEERESADEEWWRRYKEYLCTSAWGERRELVLRRANGMCEGCLKAQATQVHHLTYKHVTNEFLWELVAVCRDCHERFHERKDD